MTRAYVGLGSNVGDRAVWCREAAARLAALPATRLLAVSPLLETPPAEGAAGGPFLNGAAELETALPPRALLEALRAIEVSLGRPAERPRGAARTIDLDLLLYGEQQVMEADLVIPHPRLAARRFVLQPLAAIAPEVRHPGLQRTAAELLRDLETVTPSPEARP